MTTPLITVAIPTYNNGRYLAAAISSVLAQRYELYDVVVVDDGSTDETREIVASFGSRVRYHYQPNQGLAVARNTGLDLARTEYLTYLDGDDIMLPDNLAAKAAVLSAHPELGGVFSDFEVFSDTATLHERGILHTFGVFERTGRRWTDMFPHHERVESGAIAGADFYWGPIFDELFQGNFILPSTMVFNRAMARDVGCFVPTLRTQQDYEFWLRFSQSRPFGYLDRVLLRYRRHARQLTDRSNIIRVIETSMGIVARYEDQMAARGRARVFNRRKAQILQNLAKAYMTAGRRRDARRALLEAMRRDPAAISNAAYFVAALLPGPWVSAAHRTLSGRRA